MHMLCNNMKLNRVFFLLFLSFALASDGYGFDGKREGFLLGIGVGPSITHTRVTEAYGDDSWQLKSDNRFSISLLFDVGYAPSDRIALSWCNSAWFFNARVANDLTRNFAVGFSGPTVKYYFSPQVKSWYVTAGLGMSFHTDVFNLNGSHFDEGFGAIIGFGRELSKHYSISSQFLMGQPRKPDDGGGRKIDVVAIGLTVNWQGF